MSAQILDGKLLAAQLKQQLQEAIKDVQTPKKRISIVSITIGDNPSTVSYLKSQKKTAEELSIYYQEKSFSHTVAQEAVLNFIQTVNQDNVVHGVIINKPLPASIDHSVLINALDPSKDIEGLGERNLGRLLLGKSSLIPCTAAGALALLKSSNVSLGGRHAVVLGRSDIIGKPISLLLLKEDVTVTICHSKTMNIEQHIQRADIVVAALGQKRFVQGSWIKPGAIVIDVGINDENGKMVGDVDFDSCIQKAAFISPVPGGVGPVTSVMLMKNAWEAFRKSS